MRRMGDPGIGVPQLDKSSPDPLETRNGYARSSRTRRVIELPCSVSASYIVRASGSHGDDIVSSIKYDRLYSGPDGKSRVQRGLQVDLTTRDFVPPAPPIEVSTLEEAATYAFLRVPAGFVGDWHPSPKRQWVFYLQGEMEYEAGDGSKWRVGPGSYMLTEDTTGEGHRSRVVSETAALLVAIQLDH